MTKEQKTNPPIVDIAEGSRLIAVSVDGDGLIEQGLNNEFAHDTAIVGVHVRPIGVEDTAYLGLDAVNPVVSVHSVSAQRLPSS